MRPVTRGAEAVDDRVEIAVGETTSLASEPRGAFSRLAARVQSSMAAFTPALSQTRYHDGDRGTWGSALSYVLDRVIWH